MKNTQSADFCADQIDIIMNFAVITNALIKRVHCIAILYNPHQCRLAQNEKYFVLKFAFSGKGGISQYSEPSL